MRRAILLALPAVVATVDCSSHCDLCKVDTASQDLWPPGDHAPAPEPGRHIVEVTSSRVIVPGPGLPERIEPLLSNNNLDVARFDGRTYLAFRTGPSHFASAEAVVHVVSSVDEEAWTFEATFDVDSDLREPRFLPVAGRLFLYLTQLGTDPESFEPGVVKVTSKAAGGAPWGTLEPLFKNGELLWRTALHDGVAYATWYTGGREIYRPLEVFGKEKVMVFLETLLPTPLFAGKVEVHFGTTTDGLHFQPIASPMHVGGASETAFAFDESGDAYAVMRTELPEQGGFAGSNVCKASKGDLAHWSCKKDPRKFDSPFMFRHDGEIYLIARRHLAAEGKYAAEEVKTVSDYSMIQAKYACARKRCAIWRYVKGEDRIAYVTDLPSRGDTCFPSVLPGLKPGEIIVYDYSQPLNDTTEQRWCEAQFDYTQIYRHVVRLTPNDGSRTQTGAYRTPLADAGACGP